MAAPGQTTWTHALSGIWFEIIQPITAPKPTFAARGRIIEKLAEQMGVDRDTARDHLWHLESITTSAGADVALMVTRSTPGLGAEGMERARQVQRPGERCEGLLAFRFGQHRGDKEKAKWMGLG